MIYIYIYDIYDIYIKIYIYIIYIYMIYMGVRQNLGMDRRYGLACGFRVWIGCKFWLAAIYIYIYICITYIYIYQYVLATVDIPWFGFVGNKTAGNHCFCEWHADKLLGWNQQVSRSSKLGKRRNMSKLHRKETWYNVGPTNDSKVGL